MLQSILGIFVFILIAYLLSDNKSKISYKIISFSLFLQFLLGFIFLKFDGLQKILFSFNDIILSLDKSTKVGSQFMFGFLSGSQPPYETINPESNFILAFQVLPIILVISAISSLLFHLGIIQKIIYVFSWFFNKTIKTDGLTSFGISASLFFGIIETPILLKKYLNKMSFSQLLTISIACMATVAGTVMALYANVLENIVENPAGQILVASIMSAPASILIAHIISPILDISSDTKEIPKIQSTTDSSFEAIIAGTSEGLNMVLNIIAIIIVLFALVSLTNLSLQYILGTEVTLQTLLAYPLTPICWLMGVPWSESFTAGQLLATKIVLNEFVSYVEMAKLNTEISYKTRFILTYAMCGFANLASVGILIGGLKILIPERKKDLASLSLKSLIGGLLATMMTGAIANILTYL